MANASSSADTMMEGLSAEGDLEQAFSTIDRMRSNMRDPKVKRYTQSLPYWVQQWARITRLVLGIKPPNRRGGKFGRKMKMLQALRLEREIVEEIQDQVSKWIQHEDESYETSEKVHLYEDQE